MRGISMWEPWATLKAINEKEYETRSWSTDYRGPLVIQSSKRFTGDQQLVASLPVFCRSLQKKGIWVPSIDLKPTLGHLLAVGNLVDVIPTEQIAGSLSEKELAFGDFSPGRFAWKFKDMRLIDPVPFKGAQGFFFVRDNLIRYPAPVPLFDPKLPKAAQSIP